MISFETLRLEEDRPIYLQIIRHIQRGIVSGAIQDGDELPSRRVLSARLGVNPNTIQKAYRMLEEGESSPPGRGRKAASAWTEHRSPGSGPSCWRRRPDRSSRP